jgi:simple sugar transport system ATP-binding protein
VPLLSLTDVGKSFVPGRPVLRDVALDVVAGEIHAILGENGAGKSTLMNILIGLVRPDAGEVRVDGKAIDLDHFDPSVALRAGVAMVHQHSTLIPSMTVEENFGFGDPRGGFVFDPAAATARLEALSERYGLEASSGARVEDLSVGERQRAEILRALDRGARLLILDEPTAALTPTETQALFPALEKLRDAGHGVIFISHKLDEIEAIADRVTVLRRGQVVDTLPVRGLDARDLGRMMLGRDLPALAKPAASVAAQEPILRLDGLCARGLRDASSLRALELAVHPGEIVGLAGIDGNGQRELEEVLVGARRIDAGRVWLDGEPITPDVRGLRRRGVSHLSGDRERAGLIRGFSLSENWILKGSHDDRQFFPRGRIAPRAARAATLRAIERFDIHPPDPDADIATLSGGNAQKLAVARELEGEPRLLIAVNPTRGLDVGSARFVHERLLELRGRGGGVLLISTELDEVLALSDRVLALVGGQILPLPASRDRAAIGAVLLGRGAS